MHTQQHHKEQPAGLEQLLVWALRLGIIVSLFSVFIFNSRYFYPYIVPRAVFFQITTEILLVISLFLMAFFPKYRPKATKVSIGIALFILIIGIATLTSADRIKSFIGTVERSLGFFHILHFSFLFLAASIAFRTAKQWLWLLAINVALSSYIALQFGLGYLITGHIGHSLMGNPTFLGAYLIFNMFFAIFINTQINNKWLKFVLWIVAAIAAFAILATHVRGAFVGMSAGLLFLLTYQAWKHKQWRIPIIGLIAALIVIYALIFVNRDGAFVRGNSILSRITTFSFENVTIKSRLSIWKIAYSGFKERPILGWGPENYSFVFNTHFDPSFNTTGVTEGWEDRAHNIVFDMLVNTGIVGLASYVFLMIASYLAVKKSPVLTALIIAYIIQNFFGVETLNSYLTLFVFLAFAYFVETPEPEEINEPPAQKTSRPAVAALISIASTALVFTGMFYLTLRPAAANVEYNNALLYIRINNKTEFDSYFKKASDMLKSFPSLETEHLSILSSTMLREGGALLKNNTYRMYVLPIIDKFETVSKRREQEQRLPYILSQLLLQCSVALKDSTYLDKSHAILMEMLNGSPDRDLFKAAYTRSLQARKYLENVAAGTGT